MTEKELLAARQSIVQKLTQARLEKGLSQEQLAKRIGTQRSNICRIEKGTQNLSLDLMLKIAEALDKDVSVMLEERSSTMEKVYSLRLYDETLLTFTLEEICELLQMTREEVDTQRQRGYIRFSVQNGMTVYEITDILRLKNMLEMGKIYRKIDEMVITIPVKKETGNVTDSLTD